MKSSTWNLISLVIGIFYAISVAVTEHPTLFGRIALGFILVVNFVQIYVYNRREITK